jgi:hypothetical protein
MKPSAGNAQVGKASMLGWVRNSASGVAISAGRGDRVVVSAPSNGGSGKNISLLSGCFGKMRYIFLTGYFYVYCVELCVGNSYAALSGCFVIVC